MTLNVRHTIPAVAAALLALTALPGCFTGIEKTPVIKDSGSSSGKVTITPEQQLMGKIHVQPPRDWRAGKPFIVAEGRLSYAYAPASVAGGLHSGDTIRLSGIAGSVRLSGDSITELTFTTPNGATVSTKVESPLSAVMASATLPVPFAIDADMVADVRALLTGREVWTLRKAPNGRKYERMTIEDVIPGNADYPLKVIAGGDSLFMVVSSRSSSARTFDNLFSLSNPRRRYPQISDKNWDLICRGKIAVDMTREECRLALGAPAEVDRDAAYNGIIERWTYENGVYLVFTDGLLTRFRL